MRLWPRSLAPREDLVGSAHAGNVSSSTSREPRPRRRVSIRPGRWRTGPARGPSRRSTPRRYSGRNVADATHRVRQPPPLITGVSFSDRRSGPRASCRTQHDPVTYCATQPPGCSDAARSADPPSPSGGVHCVFGLRHLKQSQLLHGRHCTERSARRSEKHLPDLLGDHPGNSATDLSHRPRAV